MKATLTLVVIAISLLLQACGGGSSEGDELREALINARGERDLRLALR